MTKQITIAGRRIADSENCYVIAEIGHNHGGDIEACKDLIRKAHLAGADAVKLQKRDNSTLYTKSLLNQPYEHYNSHGKTYYEHRIKLEFNYDQIRELAGYAAETGITLFATPFDIPSAELLVKVGVPAYKISSGSITDLDLIRYIAQLNRPIIVSTGGSTWEDIDRVYALLSGACCEFALLHCVASYPNKAEEVALPQIQMLMQRYPDIIVGYSDHYNGLCMSEAAYTMGARIIEKHFTLDRSMRGTDHAMSCEPHLLENLVSNLKKLRSAMTRQDKTITESEYAPISKMRKGIYPTRRILPGEIIQYKDIVLKIPSGGLAAYRYDDVVGRIAINELSTASPINEGDID